MITKNSSLNELIGKTLNNKTQKEAFSYMYEQQKEFFKPLFPVVKETCLVVNTGIEGDEILAIGASCVDDIITDNFGKWFASTWFYPQTASQISVTLQNTVDTGISIAVIGGDNLYQDTIANVGYYIQNGSGTTAPARGDTVIETALSTSPESAVNAIDGSSWSQANGQLNLASTIFAGGSGTVAEVAVYGDLYSSALAQLHRFLMFHDAISPSVAFTAGQKLSTIYEVNM